MTMHTRISHNLTLSVPFVALLAVFVAIGAFGMFVLDPLVTNDPQAAPVVATIGDGVDEFTLRTGNIFEGVVPNDAGGWIAAIAIFVTIWSVIKVIRELRGPVGGSHDAGALTSHVANTTMVALGIRSPGISWGIVRDATSGHPLPLARVRLVGIDGIVLGSCVADRTGRYGFNIGYAALVQHGYHARLEPQKSGYYPSSSGRIPLMAGAHHGLDVMMDRAGDGPVPVHAGTSRSHMGSLVDGLMFWFGVLLVPLAFLQDPDMLHGLIFAMFIGVAAVRATWRHPRI
jgi:hypothetical protein